MIINVKDVKSNELLWKQFKKRVFTVRLTQKPSAWTGNKILRDYVIRFKIHNVSSYLNKTAHCSLLINVSYIVGGEEQNLSDLLLRQLNVGEVSWMCTWVNEEIKRKENAPNIIWHDSHYYHLDTMVKVTKIKHISFKNLYGG
jgi:hypothetical protein